MREEEEIVHQPRLRAMYGPSRFATGSGSFRHIAMNARYFGFSGLFSGTFGARISLYS